VSRRCGLFAGFDRRSAHVDQEIADPDPFGKLYPALGGSRKVCSWHLADSLSGFPRVRYWGR